MSLEADRTYDGTITGAELMYANSGTPGIQVFIEYGEGEKTSTIWYLTNKTADRVKETLTDLGIDGKNLVSESFLDTIGNALAGKEISFTTHEEEYKGKHTVKVQWVNPRKKNADTNVARAAARLFGAKPGPVDDDSIPF